MIKIYSLFSLSYLVLLFISAFILVPFNYKPHYQTLAIQEKNINLKGTILDKKTNLPIPHAHLSVVGQKTYVEANSDGLFTLNLKPEFRNSLIKVTSLGYLAQKFAVADFLKRYSAAKTIRLLLVLDYKNLQVVDKGQSVLYEK